MMRKLNDDISIVLTLDGPRGPKYNVQQGAVALAASCGVPLIPVSLNAPKRWQLKNWDQTQIPKPFSKVEVSIGPALRLSKAVDGKKSGVDAERLKKALLAVTDDQWSIVAND